VRILTLAHGERAYIDTMLFVYHLARPRSDILHRLSLQFFEDVEKGTYEGVVTSFTQTEYTAVMQELLTQRIGTNLTDAQVSSVKREFDSFIEREGIELLDADDLSTELGRSEIFRWGKQVVDTCRCVMGRRDYKWRTIVGADAIHAVFANRAGADVLATFDEGFRALDGLASSGWKLKPLIISEAYHP
jgi:predicted nucleic acid-binding protein